MIVESAARAIKLYSMYPVQLSLIAAVALPSSLLGHFIAGTAFSILILPAIMFIGAVVFAVEIHASHDAISGRAPSFTHSYSWVLERLWHVIEAELRYLGAWLLLLVTIIGIPFAVRLFVRWFFVSFEVVIADRDPKSAISASCDLVARRWWLTAGRVVAPSLTILVPALAVSFFIPVVGRILWLAIASLVISPLFALYFTTVYLEYKGTHAPVTEVLQTHTGSSQI